MPAHSIYRAKWLWLAGDRMQLDLRRREFIKLLGGAAATWPLVARAQQSGAMRRIGVLLSTHEGDPGRRAQLAALVQRLTELGWTDGRNARLDLLNIIDAIGKAGAGGSYHAANAERIETIAR